MRHFNRVIPLTIAFVLIFVACTPALAPAQDEPERASVHTNPTTAPANPKSAPTKAQIPLPEKAATYESSVPVTLWDGKAHQHLLKLVDPANGQPIAGYEPLLLGVNYFHSYSPDQKTLAIVTFQSDMSPSKPVLHILDLAAWRDSVYELETTGWVSSLAFSPDGNLLAIAQNYRDSNLTVFDLKSKSVLAQTPIEFMASRMKFSADGQSLMLYGSTLIDRFTENERSDGPPVVALLNAADLSTDWSEQVESLLDGIYPVDESTQNLHQPGAAIYYSPGLAFSPLGDVLYIVHPDKEELTTINFTDHSIQTVQIRPKLSWIERLLMLTAGVAYAKAAEGTTRSVAISSDGQQLYSVGSQSKFNQLSNGEFELVQTPLNFQVIATSDGSELTEIESNASDLTISPDGKMVLVNSWAGEDGPWTDMFDIKSGKFVAHFDAAYLLAARRMDGSPVLVSAIQDLQGKNQYWMSAYAYENGDLLGTWTIPNYGNWLTVQ